MKKKISTKWELKFSPLAIKDIKKLDKATKSLIMSYLVNKIEHNEDPRRFGKPLSRNLKNYWRYRIHDYRVICEINQNILEIMVVRIAHRRRVYEKIHLLKSPA